MKASVIIPVKNGGEIFKKVLQRVLGQKTLFDYEVLIVDSGSSDGSKEYVLSQNDNKIRFEEIKPEDFGHGKTRNYAASLAKGEFLAFITQDALPVDKNWLSNLIDGFRDDPEVFGVFGKHLPYQDALPVEKQQIIDHFDQGFGKEWLKFKIKDEKDYENRQGWYIFYSDNNSCMRKSAWEKYKYRDVWMSEDQFWAKDILEAGFAKAYVPEAAVYHSHKYSFKQIIKRSYDEYSFHVSAGNVSPASVKDVVRFFLGGYKYSLKVILGLDANITRKIYWGIFYICYDIARTYGFYHGTHSQGKINSRYSMQDELIKK